MTPTRREEQRQQRADTRQRILEAASVLLEQRPWNELRLEDVMTAAGLSRTVFYRHFDDRATLLLAMLEEILEHIGATGTAWKQGVGEPVGALRTGLSELSEAMRKYGRLMQAIADSAADDAETRTARAGLVQAFVAVTADRIRADVDAGRSSVRDPWAVADALVRMNESLLLDAFGRPPYPDPGEIAAVMNEIWVCTIYGRRALDELDAPEPPQRST